MLIDAHSHLDRYGQRLDVALAELECERIFTVATAMDVPSYHALRAIGARSPWVLPTFGIHPRCAADYANRLDELADHIEHSPAIGEIGLDFHWVRDATTYPAQSRVLEFFLAAATEQDKFVNLHTKGAEAEVLAMLRRHRVRRAIVHWYSGPLDVLEGLIEHGCYFTIGVEVQFSDAIRAIARAVPDHRLLTETDNPGALGWVRNSGEIGMPGAIKDVVGALAKLRHTTPAMIAGVVYDNFMRLLEDDPRLARARSILTQKRAADEG